MALAGGGPADGPLAASDLGLERVLVAPDARRQIVLNMKAYVGITHRDWYHFLAGRPDLD